MVKSHRYLIPPVIICPLWRTTAGTHSYGYIQIDQLLKLEGIMKETGGQIKSLSMKASLL